MLNELIARAKADPSFHDVAGKVARSGIETWLEPDEKALLFGVGAFAPAGGAVVEVGSFQGGSASFLAAGIARRGSGRLDSVDPHLGAPPWFGLSPQKRTFEPFQRCLESCGLTDWVRPHLSDSASLAAVWPAEPVDAVYLDGDHSFLGSLQDFESWAPKVRPGGLVLFDDANGPIAELNELIALIQGLRSVAYLGTVEGVAAFRRNDVGAWAMLAELTEALSARGVFRPWDLSCVHRSDLPPNYRRDRPWPNSEIGEAYMISFLARCGPGGYGFSASSTRDDRRVLGALSEDCGDGDVVALDGLRARVRSWLRVPTGRFRVILCAPEEAGAYAPWLLPGGVLIARHTMPEGRESTLRVRRLLLDAGLSGCGCSKDLHWGIWRPHHLSPEAILHYATGAA
jgi:hypothetical protein